MAQKIRIIDCQTLAFSRSLSQNRMQRALLSLGQKAAANVGDFPAMPGVGGLCQDVVTAAGLKHMHTSPACLYFYFDADEFARILADSLPGQALLVALVVEEQAIAAVTGIQVGVAEGAHAKINFGADGVELGVKCLFGHAQPGERDRQNALLPPNEQGQGRLVT